MRCEESVRDVLHTVLQMDDFESESGERSEYFEGVIDALRWVLEELGGKDLIL